MPGTILVSVLEFMDLPLSSSTSIRVSMGKIEYQINDKGNFSFPLTSLRDDLIVKIQDADGNEISRTGVHIRLILEKGVWEDIFPLGDGRLHLKLQFVLNDEERDRIRIMRQSALKKKHDELRGSGTTGKAASPSRANDEVSESPKEFVQHEAVSQLQGPVGFLNDKESGTRNVVGAQLDQSQLKPNFGDQSKSTKPVLQVENHTQSQHKGKKPANQSPHEKQPQGVVGLDEMAIMLRSSEQNFVSNNRIKEEEGLLKYSEKKSAPRRTPSNVRKMISAFESGLAQDMRPHIKPPPEKFQSSKIETKDSSKTQHLEQDKSPGISQGTVENASQENYSQEAPVYVGESRQKINILNKQTDSKARNKLDKYYSLESSGVWIFPDESRKTCVTTSGKSVMGIVESQCLRDQRSLNFSKLENMEKKAGYVGTGTEGSKYERIKENKESKTSSPDDDGDESSGGPINQVIKVAIIVGFGLLVLLTRQRKRRHQH